MNLEPVLLPEFILIGTACALFLLGISAKATARKIAPFLALAALLAVFFILLLGGTGDSAQHDSMDAIRVFEFATYIKMLSAGVGCLFVLLSWPSGREAVGNSAISFGTEAAEYFGLMLLAISGIFLVAGANELILLFLGIELASIPTYIMVSISRPLPVAQEAGVKYFFLGAMSAAIMLFGFSYLYGTTGTTSLSELRAMFFATQTGKLSAPTMLSSWQMLAVVMLIVGFAFKLAAAPLHFYAADVYQGAATPVTALLSFVPKISGMVALLKILYCIGGGTWAIPHEIAKLIWVLAVLTMTIGNTLGLLQLNVKRVLAYSSIAHSGYMLVAIAALCSSNGNTDVQNEAVAGVLFYLAAYGIMNAAAFGVLMLLPAREPKPATSAETYEDIAGTGRAHTALGLAMAVACFSLIGLPLTVGFFGKFYLIRPALNSGNYWLVGITMVNAAISAGYYLKIVGTMFLRGDATTPETAAPAASIRSMPITLAIGLSVAGTLMFGTILPATTLLNNRTIGAARMEDSQTTQASDFSPARPSARLIARTGPETISGPKIASVR